MYTENKILNEDLEYIASVPFIAWEKLKNATFFITGGTGLIGQTLISALLHADEKRNLGLKITALVRNEERARDIFCHQLEKRSNLTFIEGSVENLPVLKDEFDFVIHGASPTSSRFFISNPVETIEIAVKGTMNILSAIKDMKVKGFCYLSSMEVYGTPHSDDPIRENFPCDLDLSLPRNSYPESKRLCEALVTSYFSEYEVPTRIIRLAQTFGPGVKSDDERVFAQFARAAIKGQDILLTTAGKTKRTYLYTADAATAILSSFTNGQSGEIYNAANKDTFCSILEMANMVAGLYPQKHIKVICNAIREESQQYAKEAHLNLSTEKLNSIGWRAHTPLNEMYRRMIESSFI